MTTTVLAYIPSPSQGVWHLGPIPIRAYALFIIVGIIAALLIGDRRWVARGGEPGAIACERGFWPSSLMSSATSNQVQGKGKNKKGRTGRTSFIRLLTEKPVSQVLRTTPFVLVTPFVLDCILTVREIDGSPGLLKRKRR